MPFSRPVQILPPEQHEGCTVEMKSRLHSLGLSVRSEVLEHGKLRRWRHRTVMWREVMAMFEKVQRKILVGDKSFTAELFYVITA